MKKVEIFTDGACSGNPGPGGFGVILKYNESVKEISKGYKSTTNNRMDLLAVITGLEALKFPCDVTVYSDSKYVVDAIVKGWLSSWQMKGWKKSDGKPALNIDLWQRLVPLLEKHNAHFVWLKGHAGHEYNEKCDSLAVAASQSENLLIDAGVLV